MSATKGPSNHFGNARGGRQGKRTAHIGYAWARGFNKRTVDDHFNRHGSQMDCLTKESYVAHAVNFANTVDRRNCVCKIINGKTYKYNRKTNTLVVVVNKTGVVLTYFKPKEGYSYFKERTGD